MISRRSWLCLLFCATLAAPNLRPAAEPTLTIDSPQNMQVFQRHTLDAGPVVISGKLAGTADSLRYRIQGKPRAGQLDEAWQPIPLGDGQAFRLEKELPAGGWYVLTVEALKGGQPVASAKAAKVGVGEVFVTAGQSNSTSCGQFKTKQTSGMVASFDGQHWAAAEDPMPGAHDLLGKSAPIFRGGSPWPAFGDAMYKRYNVPIGVAVTGHGGSSVLQWQPTDAKGQPGDMFTWMMARIKSFGPHGFRAVLWHQGESDVGMPTDAYVANLTRVIEAAKQQAGWEFPWLVAKVSYHNPRKPRHENTRAAHQKLWETGVAFQGPDTDTLVGADRDQGGKGIHFSPSGLKKHGEMWASAVGDYFDMKPRSK